MGITLLDQVVFVPGAETGVVGPRQAKIRDLVIGEGTGYEWRDGPPAWWAERDLRTSDTPRGGSHGLRGGYDRYGSQTLTGTLVLLGDPDTLPAMIDELEAAFAPTDVDLEVVTYFLGRVRSRFGRPRKLAVTVEPGGPDDTAVATFQFEALDPFAYSATERSAATGPAAPGSGFTPPFTPPIALGAGTSGAATVENDGTAPAHWTATISGPASGIVLRNLATGGVLDLSAAGGLVLGASDVVVLDSRERTVTLNGLASRAQHLTPGSDWWTFPPGGTPVAYGGTGGSVEFAWRDCYY